MLAGSGLTLKAGRRVMKRDGTIFGGSMNAQSIRTESSARRVHHPGMTREWFLAAVNRALSADMVVYEGPRRNIVIVPSETMDRTDYTTSRQWCTCPGHYYTGRCLHRALAIAWIDVLDLRPLSRFETKGRAVAPTDLAAEREKRKEAKQNERRVSAEYMAYKEEYDDWLWNDHR